MIVNGKEYPLWSQFIEKKADFIGKKLVSIDEGQEAQTIVTDLTLEPNGKDSAMFRVHGKDFNCGFDVHHGGISGDAEGVEQGYISFSSTYCGTFRIYHAK